MEYPEHYVCDLADVDDPGAAEFTAESESDWPFRGMVVRWQGQIYAYANRCPHAGHALNLIGNQFFEPSKQLLICASHGALFEPATGICVGGPCPGKSLQALVCEVRDQKIFVRFPDSQHL